MSSKTATAAPRRVNPVYKHLRDQVHAVSDGLRAEYDAGGDLRERLMKGNHGVRCFMRWQDIAGVQSGDHDAAVNGLINEFRVKGAPIRLNVSTDSAINFAVHVLEDVKDVMVALYAPNTSRADGQPPQADPIGMVYGGLPSEITDLALRSDLLWRLKAPALYLAESNELCKLHATTAFYLPSVEVRKASFDEDYQPYEADDTPTVSVTLTSDVQCVMDFWRYKGREQINVSSLIRSKLLTPLLMALRQNQNRKKLGLPIVRNVVIGDMNIPNWEHGINTLFSDRVKDVLQQFEGCFDSITVCSKFDTAMHLSARMQCQDDAPTQQ